MYLEGSDQHRGWFHSSLLTSVGNEGFAPYESVLTHGFVVDGSGRKMSKSLGNVISPEEIIEKFGAEILRLWVIYEDYRDDIKISKDIIARLVETYRRIRNTLRFLHANINGDFDPATNAVPYDKMSSLDKWALSRLQRLIEKVRTSYDEYAFHAIYHSIHNFCTVDLSALYLDIVKDRIYVERKDALKRRAAQTVIFDTLVSLLKLLTPVLSSTSEEMWSYLTGFEKEESVLLASFPAARKDLINAEIEEEWDRIWKVREIVNKKIEEKRAAKEIGHSLDTKVVVTAPADEYALMKALGGELKDIFIVSQVELKEGNEVTATVFKADGKKCERCWQYNTELLDAGQFTNVCKRCADTLSSL
jgi:isoleucyl-tRNA synthetase